MSMGLAIVLTLIASGMLLAVSMAFWAGAVIMLENRGLLAKERRQDEDEPV